MCRGSMLKTSRDLLWASCRALPMLGLHAGGSVSIAGGVRRSLKPSGFSLRRFQAYQLLLIEGNVIAWLNELIARSEVGISWRVTVVRCHVLHYGFYSHAASCSSLTSFVQAPPCEHSGVELLLGHPSRCPCSGGFYFPFMRSGVACMIFGTSRAALGVGMPVEGLVDMARSRVLVRLDTLQPAHIDGDDGVCDSITAGPSCPRGTDGSSVLPRGLIPDSLRSRGLDDRGLFKAVVSAVSPDGLKSDVGPLPRRLPPRPSAEFLRKSWSAGEGDLEWELLESGPLDRGGVDDGVLGEVAHNAVRQGAFEVAFKRPVVLTSMTVRMAQPEGYVLVRGILPGEDEKLRWWCVLTGAGDHNVIEVARTLSSIPSRWGTASVPVDGLDIGSVRFHTNRPVKIISMEAVVEGPSVGGGESSVLVLHQGGEKGKGLVGYEGLVGPRAPYVDMATVMREGMTWRKEQDLQDVQDPPALLFSMGKLRRTLAILASPESSCCFCGNTRKDALRTAKVLVSRMEQVVGTHWGRHAAANIDCIVEYAVASAKGHNLAFLDVFSTQECGCDGRQECTVTSSGIQQSLEALSRRLDWVERAFRKSGEAAEEGPPPDGGSGEMKDIIAAEVYEPYSHHRLHRASRSGISATELLDFLEDMMADGGTAPPSDVAGWKRKRARRRRAKNDKR